MIPPEIHQYGPRSIAYFLTWVLFAGTNVEKKARKNNKHEEILTINTVCHVLNLRVELISVIISAVFNSDILHLEACLVDIILLVFLDANFSWYHSVFNIRMSLDGENEIFPCVWVKSRRYLMYCMSTNYKCLTCCNLVKIRGMFCSTRVLWTRGRFCHHLETGREPVPVLS